MLKFNKLKHKDVKTNDFGDEVTIRVNAESIKFYAKKISLLKKIESMKLSVDDELAYNVAAGLMAICTNPVTGLHSFEDEQLSDFVNMVSFELFNELSFANLEVNPANFANEVEKTMTAKKKST